MLYRELFINEKEQYEHLVKHVVQSWNWGDAKDATGAKSYRFGLFDNTDIKDGLQFTLHQLPSPLQAWRIGHFPKGPLPTEEMLQSLTVFGQQHNCIFIKIEPNVFGPVNDPNIQAYLKQAREQMTSAKNVMLVPGKELFTKYNFLLDLTQSDDQLFANMHEKTRYNIGLAQRKGVQVQLHTDDEAFKTYLKLYFETTKRQGYYGHTVAYHQQIWQTLRRQDMARLLIATYENTPLTAWMLLNFHDTLYYPYGGSTLKFRNVMASNLVAWSAIQLGKQMGLRTFDMWGCMGPNPDINDPWYGFHKFKSGYGPTHVEYIGTYDLVINPAMYKIYLQLEKWRTKWLRLKAKFR